MSEPRVQPEPGPEQRPPGGGFVAGAIMVLGFVILVPSGLCTGFMTIGSVLATIFGSDRWSDTIDTIQMALIVGGPFVLLGGGLLWLGIWLRHR